MLAIDAGWIGAVASTIAVALTVVIYFITRKKKRLSYEVLSEYPLISIDNEIRGKLQVLLDGKPVEDVHLLLIKFSNQGNVPIAASDYEKPLTLTFTDNTQILSSEYVSASPPSLAPEQTIKDQVISFEPILLNGGDYFTTKILVAKTIGRFDVDARILGVKSIERASNKRRKVSIKSATLEAVIVAVVLLGSLSLLYLWSLRFPAPAPEVPRINSLSVSRHIVPEQETTRVTAYLAGGYCGCLVENPDRPCMNNLSCQWAANRGMVVSKGDGSEAEYVSPLDPGPDVISLKITNIFSGKTDAASIEVQVVDPKTLQPTPQPTK